MAFAGDALICYFGPIKEDQNDLTKCCIRAINCGNELKLLQTNSLSAHIAIDYGTSSLSFIGGYQNMWTYIYDGDCFNSLESCISDAKLQQLVISPEVTFLVQQADSREKAFSTLLLPSGNSLVHRKISPLPSTDHIPVHGFDSHDLDVSDLFDEGDHQVMKSLMVDQLRRNISKHLSPNIISFVPEPILVNLTQSTPTLSEIVHVSSELREVICMFLKLDSYHPSRTVFPFERLQNFYAMFQLIIYSLGGFIRQIVTDDKGCVCIALWGVPTASHINNTQRSVFAAAHLSDYCQKNDLKISIGITTGDVYCGKIGSNTRCDYAAVGTSINLAARLMSVAKGGVLFDDRTFYAIDKNLASQCFKQLPLTTLKGRNEPVQTYEFRAASLLATNTARRPSLAGLPADIAQLSQLVRDSTTGTVHFVVNPSGSVRTPQNRPTNEDIRLSGKHLSNRSPSPRSGDSVHPGLMISGRSQVESNHDTFLSKEIRSSLLNALSQLKTWNEKYQGIRLYYDEDTFRDDNLIAYTEGKLLDCESFDDHLIQILFVLGIPGTGKTEVTTQLSYYCYAESLKYIYLTLNDLHYQSEYGVLRLLFSHLIGLDIFHDLNKQKAVITSLFFETFPPTLPFHFLIEKFYHLKIILGLSWFPPELTIKSKFSKFANSYRSRNKLSVREIRPREMFFPNSPPSASPSASDQSSPPKDLSPSRNTSFFGLSKRILSIGSEVDDSESTPVDPMESSLLSQNKFLTVLLLLRQCIQKSPPTAIIIDEFQHCDNLSWAILLYMISHLQAPLLFLFTITEPFSHQMQISQSRMFASVDRDDSDGQGQGQYQPFLNTSASVYEPSLIDIQKKSKNAKRYIRSISSLDPSAPQDKLLHKNANKIKILNYLNRTFVNVVKIQLSGLKKRDVKLLLQSNLQAKHVTSSLISIVTDLCEGNIYWCKAIIEFIRQFGEDSFCDSFCCNSSFGSPPYTLSNSGLVLYRNSLSGSSTPRSLTADRVESLIPGSPARTCNSNNSDSRDSRRGSLGMPLKVRQKDFPFYQTHGTSSESHSQSSVPPGLAIDPLQSFEELDESQPFEQEEEQEKEQQKQREEQKVQQQEEQKQKEDEEITDVEDYHKTSSKDSMNSLLLAGDVILYRLITTLMDSMTYVQKELLKYASVLGLKFSSKLLFQLMENEFENENEFNSTIESLCKQNFFIEHFPKSLFASSTTTAAAGAGAGRKNTKASSSPEISLMNYSFLSHRMRDIIYNLIPCSDSSRIHCLVAYQIEHTVLSAGYSSSSSSYQSYYEILTFHYYIASTSSFQLTKDDQKSMNRLMNRTVEFLGEISMNEFPDPRPAFLIPNFFFLLNDATSHCKTKSYQYSLLTSRLYFQLHEYDKSFGYLRYSAEPETRTLMISSHSIHTNSMHHQNYHLEVKKLLLSWVTLCQQYQDAGTGDGGSGGGFLATNVTRQRASVTALLEKHIQICCLLREYEGFET
jgi:hypothetical protein